ncbi:MAG: hypothetical protein AAF497_07285 [Planctomycetota bacterium]
MRTHRNLSTVFIIAMAVLSWSLVGCEPPDQPSGAATGTETTHSHDGGDDHAGHDHSGHGHPETLAETMTELETLMGTIKTAMSTTDKQGDADAAVHQIADLLDYLPKLGAKAGMSDEKQAELKTAAEGLFSIYGKIDTAIHAGEAFDYSTVADQIDAGFKSLGELTK